MTAQTRVIPSEIQILNTLIGSEAANVTSIGQVIGLYFYNLHL